MNALSLPGPVCRAWFDDGSILSAEPVSGGFSGATIYRCEGSRGTVALRRWPSGIAPQRINEIHHVLQTASAQGCRVVPRLLPTRYGERLLSFGSRCWDCSTWMPGQPWRAEISPLSATEAIRAGCQAIARFHQSVADIAPRCGTAPAVQTRWRRLEEVKDWLSQPLRYDISANAVPRPSQGNESPASWLPRVERQLKAIWNSYGGRLGDHLRWFSHEPVPLQYVLRDIHREHVLFEDRHVSGLIDFDAVRVDTPAADIARFVSSFYDLPQQNVLFNDSDPVAGGPHQPLTQTLWSAAMAGYRSQRPFSEQELRLAIFLAEIGPFLSLVNWAIWETTQAISFASPPDLIAARTEHLSRCLQTIFDVG